MSVAFQVASTSMYGFRRKYCGRIKSFANLLVDVI